ncbi:MAG TPA: DUF6443 domain-containing protein, partial [Dongiaceae bacterium]|nr:DUF6443 domain-containing protein [Dongiaceae bacterium]
MSSVNKTAYSNTLTVNVNPLAISGSTPNLNQNYILTRDVLIGGVNSLALINSLTSANVRAQVAYFDGLGRNDQNIAIQASPNSYDIITPVGYDSVGRQDKNYLPYSASGATGSFRTNALSSTGYTSSDQYSFYQSHPDFSIAIIPTNPFSQIHYEAASTNRVLEQGAPGQTWVVGGGHTITTAYFANTALDSVKIWTVAVSTTPGTFSTYSTSPTSNYGAGQLFKTITTDEAGHQVIEFKDKNDETILKKVQLTATDAGTGSGYSGWLCTYYIYDDIGNLRAVIQPNGVAALDASGWSMTSTILAEQCFCYEYDSHNRMYMKQVPGAAPVYTVYNTNDLPVMTQDGNLRVANKWLVTVYDSLYRPIQTRMDSITTPFATLITNTAANAFYPGQVGTLLTQTHYDDYTGLPSGLSGTLSSTGGWSSQFPATSNSVAPFPQSPVQSLATKGLVTWTQTAIVDSTPAAYISTVNIYDNKARVIQTQTQNITGGLDVTTTEYTWAGQPYWTVESHQKSGANPLTTIIWTQNNYDQAGRVTSTLEKFNDNTTWDTLSVMVYDALGQLEKKLLGKQRSATNTYTAIPLETQDYQYNSRGWLLGVNRAYAKDVSSTDTTNTTTQADGGEIFIQSIQGVNTVVYPATHYFGFDLGYDKINGVLINNLSYDTARYDGNIAGMVWKNAYDSKVRKYDFGYDAVNRLTTANFGQYTGHAFTNATVNYNVNNLSYDANGNIKTMDQYGLKSGGSSAVIDQLTYTYQTNSNKLAKVADAAATDSTEHLGDFQDGTNSGDDYAYDGNGNMISDQNKKISSITYNYLNLPSVIRVSGKGSIYYTYDAAGNKLKKTTVDSTALPAKITTTLYIGNSVYQNDTLQFFGTSEGRARPVGN